MIWLIDETKTKTFLRLSCHDVLRSRRQAVCEAGFELENLSQSRQTRHSLPTSYGKACLLCRLSCAPANPLLRLSVIE